MTGESSENNHDIGHGDPNRWAKSVFDQSVEEMMRRGIVSEMLVEARLVWALPYRVVVGQVREGKESQIFHWVISGEVPTDHIGSAAAATVREAVRHFALKWQLDAARFQDPAVQEELAQGQPDQSWELMGVQLADKAEALYALTEDDSLWQGSGGTSRT